MSPARRLSPDDWTAVNRLFHEALELPASARDRFLDETCAARPDLRDEVGTLLSTHAAAADFIERPVSPSAPLDDTASLVGQTVGHYRISSVLGVGGMGIVYLAEDTRLGRTVALKALAPQFVNDAGRRERLRREARAAAGLNDPAIATVYAFEEIGDHVFIVSEFVPGETLRDELERGALTPARALDTGRVIARALAVAHDRGIVHRDLKPENVMRTPAGAVKILDFGLARIRGDEQSPRLTGAGAVLGTPAYMSPEQIRGQPVDGRSDLFAFGVMLYELATGAHPFSGGDAASTIARILEAEPAPVPPPAAHDASTAVQHALARVIRVCLRKRPADRYASAHNLVAALQEPSGDRPAAPAPRAATRPGDPPPARAIWWWQFHQAVVSLGYLLLLIPLWQVRGDGRDLAGLLVFVGGVIAATTAVVLRLHLWFAVGTYPSELGRQRARSATWIRLADVLYVAVALAGGLRVVADRTPVGVLLISAGVGILIAFTIIEPTTTRAALDRRDGP